ncbi:hypothetical protein GCM10017776_20020 [Streptomyces griseoluteus]|nr:hypothetical protein GCM10017776_20020 [Streptomyces griseoluteus]
MLVMARASPEGRPRTSPASGDPLPRAGEAAPGGGCQDGRMVRFLRPLLRGTTYTRLLHLWVPMLSVAFWMFIDPRTPWAPALFLVPLALIPAVRRGEGVQARLLLTPGEAEPGISEEPARSWRDRGRTDAPSTA